MFARESLVIQSVQIILLCSGSAVLYGILHDQVKLVGGLILCRWVWIERRRMADSQPRAATRFASSST